MINGARAEIVQPPRTSQFAETRWTMKPTAMFATAPATGAGRNLRDACVAVRSWTRWKKNVRIVSTALNEPHVRNTEMQMVVKVRLRQSEFCIDFSLIADSYVDCDGPTGMIAGLPRRSCLPTQKMKLGTRAIDVTSKAMLEGCLISAVLPVIELKLC